MNQEKIKKIVKVKDRNGNYNNWIIYGETEDSFKVYAECDRGYIAELYIDKLYIDFYDNEIYSTEIKNPFSLMPKWYMRAEFCEIRARKGEC